MPENPFKQRYGVRLIFESIERLKIFLIYSKNYKILSTQKMIIIMS